ncbi:MAG: hypothetical protein ACK52S_12300 [Pirellula sp.]|jgi:hypothetical protein
MNDNPPNSVEVPRVAIDWYRSAPWWRLASQSVGISWRASHLLLCAVALLATHWITSISFTVFKPELVDAPASWIQPSRPLPAIAPFQQDAYRWVSELARERVMTGEKETANASELVDSAPWYPFSPDSYVQVWRRLVSYPYQAIEALTLRRSAYLLFNFLAVLAIWAFVGGCISRRSIQELGTQITSPWTDTVRLVGKRWLSIIWAIAMPIALIMVCSLLFMILGWVSNIPAVGPWITGLLLLPLVVLSVALGWCACVSIIGFPLSTSAIVCEKQADAFDGISRAAAYTFQRPVTLILAVIAAEWIGHFAGGIVSIVVNTGFSILARAFSVGSFHTILNLGTLFDSWIDSFVPLVVTAFGFSFFWTASSAIYLLLRRDVDHTLFDMIDMDAPVPAKPLPQLAPPPEATASSAETSAPSPEVG